MIRHERLEDVVGLAPRTPGENSREEPVLRRNGQDPGERLLSPVQVLFLEPLLRGRPG